MYIGDYLERRERYTPHKTAIIDVGKTPELRLTFRQCNERANRLANWLRTAAGVGKGDRVAILARDGVEHLDCLYASGKLGAIHTALNWRLHWREQAGICAEVRPKVLLYSDDFRRQVDELATALRATPHPIAHYVHLEGSGIGLEPSNSYASVLASSPDTKVTCESLEAEDIAALLFTGGTTGLPKGAMVSHRMICWNVLNTVIHDVTHGDVYLNVFPLFHTGGLFAYLSSQVVFGNTSVLLRQFDPELVLELIQRERVTVFAGVPTMYQLMTQARSWAKADLSSLRFCTSGGASLPVPVIEQYTRDKGVRFKQGFGMTEFGPGLFALSPEDAIRKAGSIGRPNFFVDVRVVDDDGKTLGPGEAGELLLKGPSACSGYYSAREGTTGLLDGEGWFHTGDIVQADDEGFFYVLDRKKDMFISGGENVYPVEIERALYLHPAVHQCAVVGLPDDKWGEVGLACVVKKPGVAVTEAKLLEHLALHLARYKVPRRVEFLDALPLSGLGKVLRRELRTRFVP